MHQNFISLDFFSDFEDLAGSHISFSSVGFAMMAPAAIILSFSITTLL
jgi:hypothetical protein